MTGVSKKWIVLYPCQEDCYSQVIPLDDIRLHSTIGRRCDCSPRVEEEVIIHNAFDGREFSEYEHQPTGYRLLKTA